MERLDFCALIKHIFETDLAKDVLKTSFLSICKPLTLNAGQKFIIKKKQLWFENQGFRPIYNQFVPCELANLYITSAFT